MAQGTKLHLWTFNKSNNQKFTYNLDGTISSELNGLVIDLQGGFQQPSLIMWPRNGSNSQIWQVGDDIIKLRDQNLCMDSPGGSKELGTEIIAQSIHGGSNQKFKIINPADVTIRKV